MSSDLLKALKMSVLAKALSADQDPLELVAKQLGVTVEYLISAILQTVVDRLRATEAPPLSPPTSTSIH
jgi:hypothetical protein